MTINKNKGLKNLKELYNKASVVTSELQLDQNDSEGLNNINMALCSLDSAIRDYEDEIKTNLR
jgi:hypothetical protein